MTAIPDATITAEAVVGGTGAYLGARGMLANPSIIHRIASMAEDPANRRTNGGGRGHYIVYLIPLSRPKIVSHILDDSQLGRDALIALAGLLTDGPEVLMARVAVLFRVFQIVYDAQFKRVIVPVVRSRMLDRTLIYTALTRGAILSRQNLTRPPQRVFISETACARAVTDASRLGMDWIVGPL